MLRQLIPIYILVYFSTTIYITGHLKNHSSNKKHFNVAGRQILIKGDNKLIAKTKTNKKGDFEVNFIDDENIKSYDFYLVSSNDTLFLKSFSTFDKETPDITLFFKCK